MQAALSQEDELLDLLEGKMLRKAREDLLSFVVYNQDYYRPAWYHRKLCKKLTAFANGEIKRLMLFTPPRHGKSELVSRSLPPFILGKDPNANVISASYNAELANDMSRDVQKLMDTDRYRACFPGTLIPREGSKTEGAKRTESRFDIIRARGVYRAVGVMKGITGKGGDFLIIDDVIKDQLEADSPTYRERVWLWYMSTFLTRAQTADASILLTMTRWHEDDLAGRLLKLAEEDEKADQWETITLPALQDRKPSEFDPRDIGEALWPKRFPVQAFDKFKSGPKRVWNALFQQRPSALAGNIIKREWIKFYDELPPDLTDHQQSWDLTFKGKDTRKSNKGSFVVGQVWGRKGPDCYLIDQYRGRPDFPGTLQAIRNLTARHPYATRKLIEDAANGPGVISMLRDEIPGLVLVGTKGQSKEERLHTASPMFEGGNVWLPRWAEELVEELVSFPNAVNDDQVDALSMSLNNYRVSAFTNLKLDLDFGLKTENWRY